MLVGLISLQKRRPAELHPLEDLVREEGIAPPARGLRDAVFGKAVNQIDIGPQQVFDTCHLLENEIAMMHQELQIKGRKGAACFGRAGGLRIQG